MAGDQVDGQVVFKNADIGLLRYGGQQCAFDFPPGNIFGVQNPALGVAAFFAEIQLARAIRLRNFALREMHPELNELGDTRWTFLNDRANDLFLAQAGSCLQGILNVEFNRILFARHCRDPSLGIVCVGFGAILLGNNRHATSRRDLQGKGKSSDAAA